MPRLFIAIDLPASHHAPLLALQDPALPARWTPPHQYHLTLRFVGDVPTTRISLLEKALETIYKSSGTLACDGLDVFPSRRKPRVLFVGLSPAPFLMAVQTAVEEAVTSAGLPGADKPFHPHITVARLKNARPQAVRGFLRRHHDFTLPPFTAQAFHLYASELSEKGATYTRLRSFRLDG